MGQGEPLHVAAPLADRLKREQVDQITDSEHIRCLQSEAEALRGLMES